MKIFNFHLVITPRKKIPQNEFFAIFFNSLSVSTNIIHGFGDDSRNSAEFVDVLTVAGPRDWRFQIFLALSWAPALVFLSLVFSFVIFLEFFPRSLSHIFTSACEPNLRKIKFRFFWRPCPFKNVLFLRYIKGPHFYLIDAMQLFCRYFKRSRFSRHLSPKKKEFFRINNSINYIYLYICKALSFVSFCSMQYFKSQRHSKINEFFFCRKNKHLWSFRGLKFHLNLWGFLNTPFSYFERNTKRETHGIYELHI